MRRPAGLWLVAWSLLLAGCLEGRFFYPDRHVYTTPQALGVEAVDVAIDGPGGARLHAWWLPAAGTARATVLHLHGNAGNVSSHLPLVAWLPRAGCQVLMLDYRGYGRSEGRPTLNGVVADARAALAWLRRQAGVDADRLVVLGQSLGGATAVRAVAQDPQGVRLVVLDAAFASYGGIVRDAAGPLRHVLAPLMRGLPGRAEDPVAAIASLGTSGVHVLVVHGSDDGIVPIRHGRALYEAAREPKQWLEVEGGNHLDALARDPVRREVLAALERALQ